MISKKLTTSTRTSTFINRENFEKMKKLTVKNIAIKLLFIFKNHIGINHRISRGNLFREIFNKEEELSLKDELRWEYVKKGMHWCRKYTKCFIGSMEDSGIWYYFVLKDTWDAQHYINLLEKNIHAMRTCQQKAMESVKKKHYKLDWFDNKLLEGAKNESID